MVSQTKKQIAIWFNTEDLQMFEEMVKKGQILKGMRFSTFVKTSFYDKMDKLQLQYIKEVDL